MKKGIKIFAMLVIIGIALGTCSIAEAAENEITIVHVGRTVELLTDEDVAMISRNDKGDISLPMASNESYSVYRYTDSFEYYVRGEMLARANAECIVWHYTDGKVHLYQRSIQLIKSVTIGAARIYGSIVNTDGSYSYTTGDRVYLYLDEGTLSFAIDFYVSATQGYFTSYEV